MGGSLKLRRVPAILAALLVLLSLPAGAGTGSQRPQGVVAAPAPKYRVFAFNDLGMHCYDSDFSVFSLLPLFNTVHAQVVMKGSPKPVVMNGITMGAIYAGVPDPNGSINTTSIGKTNFWDKSPKLNKSYLELLFGISRPPDTGILGFRMPGSQNLPKSMSYESGYRWFSATGLPITNLDDQGSVNPFPMMRVSALDWLRNQVRSSLDIVVPVSNEMNCASCHVTGMDAAPPSRLDNPPAFSDNPNPDLQVRENILILHDALNAANPGYPGYVNAAYPGYNALWDVYQSGSPILCARCHYSKALDLAGTGPGPVQQPHLYLSRAMHKHHGTIWPMMDQGSVVDWIIPIPGDGVATCYYCHPGNDTQCLRSVMAVKGMQCQNCHGGVQPDGSLTPDNGLLAVAGFSPAFSDPDWWINYPNPDTVTWTTTGQQRRPWTDLPKCQSCHSGDALSHLGDPAKIIQTLAYDPTDPACTPTMASNLRFAENPGQLFRFSQGHGMACESCHGSPHAEWPARTAGNDNVTPTQLQGYPGPIFECGVCHEPQLAPILKGPHGLHPVNDRKWYGAQIHRAMYQQNPAACQACHGLDLKGTVLSRTPTDRNLLKPGNLAVFIPAGTQVACATCHPNFQAP